MLACPADGTTRYRPRSASNALKEIVEDSLEDLLSSWEERFAKEHGPLHPRVKKLFASFTRCGDLHFGFLRLQCSNPKCPKQGELLLAYSCKVRGLCSSCGQRRAIEWAVRMVEEVLPRVPYRQLVFTIPRRFRKYFLYERSLYGHLCRAAYSATRDFLQKLVPGSFPKLKRAVPAMVVVPQSFGDLLVHHPHAHAVVSLGVFLRDGSFYSLEDVDFTGLEDLFRQRVFDFLIKADKITSEVADSMRAWPHSGERMRILAALSSPHQDEVIEKILRHVDLWAPPWKRERKARGPAAFHHGLSDLPDEEDLSPAGPIDPCHFR